MNPVHFFGRRSAQDSHGILRLWRTKAADSSNPAGSAHVLGSASAAATAAPGLADARRCSWGDGAEAEHRTRPSVASGGAAALRACRRRLATARPTYPGGLTPPRRPARCRQRMGSAPPRRRAVVRGAGLPGQGPAGARGESPPDQTPRRRAVAAHRRRTRTTGRAPRGPVHRGASSALRRDPVTSSAASRGRCHRHGPPCGADHDARVPRVARRSARSARGSAGTPRPRPGETRCRVTAGVWTSVALATGCAPRATGAERRALQRLGPVPGTRGSARPRLRRRRRIRRMAPPCDAFASQRHHARGQPAQPRPRVLLRRRWGVAQPAAGGRADRGGVRAGLAQHAAPPLAGTVRADA